MLANRVFTRELFKQPGGHMSSTKSPKWSLDSVLAALRAIPAPISTKEQATAFHDAVALLQEAPTPALQKRISAPATKELLRVVKTTMASKRADKFSDELLFALKMLAYMGTKESVTFIVKVAKSKFEIDDYMWSIVLEPFGQGHVGAASLFKSLSNPLPEKFLAIALLDAANTAAREHKLKKHPFDSRAGEAKLASYLSSRNPDNFSYAVSACASLPFLSPSRRSALFALARKHKDAEVRIEAAWATAKMGDATGLDYLVQQCLDRNTSVQACDYLSELGKRKLIPKPARDPDFAALSEMCHWLRHPNEYGEPPDRIELLDKRTLYWPPTRDTRELRLFSFVYDKRGDRDERTVGVGMVGSMTWAFFDLTKPTMKPQDIYGLHCCFELEANEDPRAPKKRSGKAGWALIKQGK